MIIIVGGGIAGLSLAWHLIKRGEKITLIEENRIGTGASWAASAYLEPRLGSGAMRNLEWAALKVWPGFIRDIEAHSKCNVDYRTQGQLRVCFADNVEKIRTDFETRKSQGWDVKWLEGAALSKLAPHLSKNIIAATFLPGVHWVDGRLLCKAIATALENSGARIIEGQRITKLLHTNGTVTGVQTSGGKFESSRVILATGNGSNDIIDLPDNFPKCRPVKGVILSLKMDENRPLIRHLLRHPNGTVLCPRSDHRLLVGSTHEDGETSNDVSEETINQLLKTATDILPDAARLTVVEKTVGIRALIGDGSLRLGHSKDISGLYYSLSHAGAGYLRAPAIAEHFAEFITNPTIRQPLIEKFLHPAIKPVS